MGARGMIDLACVGEIMVDVRVAADDADAGRPAHGSIRLDAGGSPVTAARWAVAAGASALVVGSVGDDPAARMVEQVLHEEGVETCLARKPDAATGTCIYQGSRIVASRGANAAFAPADVPVELRAHALLLSGYLLHDDSRAGAAAALARVDARWLALDVGSAATIAVVGGAERLLRLAERANVLFADEQEAQTLTGLDAEAAAAELARAFEVVFVKLGPRGAIASSGGRRLAFDQAALGRTERRVAGAGDAFAAGALLQLVRGGDLEAALAAGCRFGGELARVGPDPAAASLP